MASGVQASSLVFPGAPAATPSILTLKGTDIKASDVVSVVALGEPDVTYEKVAAIPNAPEARHGFMPSPMIIRGGIVGGDFSTPTQTKAPAATTTAAAPAPAQATASAAPASGTQKKPTAPAAASAPASKVGKVK
ncbi:hypothetical protein C1D09_012615 [Mesorhizobium intechi]|uniref:Uncharacterized protein n=1 Tax=Mesorhizobium intechi TaxID=537601 RepID=A0A8T9AQT2_9HYPH|nr:hypothetical protein [Mesorhizobium intechi]TSE11767.1 hypothetical protein C1D09_012615 [Mesorhizobium intechi]